MTKEGEVSENGEGVNEKGLPAKLLTASLKMPVIFLLVLIVLTFFGTSYFLSRYPNMLSFMGITLNPQLAAEAESTELLAEVGELMNLPEDELPTIATVTDIEAVIGQPFFKNAKNGDKVLIYASSRKAILFRPDENRIIEVGAVNINQQNPVQEVFEEISDEEEELTPDSTEILSPMPTQAEETSE